tara:strand:+ start:1667 stop:1915 length:249 start_codon:yes stop_codon:yes gene_type:complete
MIGSGFDMAKRTEIENYAISRKIVRLMREGFPQDQATAIAFRMFKDGELPIPRQPKQKRQTRRQRMDAYMKRTKRKNLRRRR